LIWVVDRDGKFCFVFFGSGCCGVFVFVKWSSGQVVKWWSRRRGSPGGSVNGWELAVDRIKKKEKENSELSVLGNLIV